MIAKRILRPFETACFLMLNKIWDGNYNTLNLNIMENLIKELLPKLKDLENKLHEHIMECQRERLEASQSIVKKRLHIVNAIYELEQVL